MIKLAKSRLLAWIAPILKIQLLRLKKSDNSLRELLLFIQTTAVTLTPSLWNGSTMMDLIRRRLLPKSQSNGRSMEHPSSSAVAAELTSNGSKRLTSIADVNRNWSPILQPSRLIPHRAPKKIEEERGLMKTRTAWANTCRPPRKPSVIETPVDYCNRIFSLFFHWSLSLSKGIL